MSVPFSFPPITPQPPRPTQFGQPTSELPTVPKDMTASDMGYHVLCPTCNGGVWIPFNEINCGIFRHAVYKCNGQQIPPHASEPECKRLLEQGLVEGCAQPFRVEPVLNQELIDGSMEIETKYRAILCPFI